MSLTTCLIPIPTCSLVSARPGPSTFSEHLRYGFNLPGPTTDSALEMPMHLTWLLNHQHSLYRCFVYHLFSDTLWQPLIYLVCVFALSVDRPNCELQVTTTHAGELTSFSGDVTNSPFISNLPSGFCQDDYGVVSTSTVSHADEIPMRRPPITLAISRHGQA